MADGEHLKIFEQGVAAWNRWRQKHRGLRPDLSTADLKRANFRYANLNDANLEHADLEGANLGRAFLEGAELHGATQRGAHFFSADLRHADLREADLREAQLWYAHLDRANLRGAALTAADLRSSELTGADLRWADLRRANLAGADLLRTDLREADLEGANLHGARFIECRLDGTSFSGAEAALTTFNALDLSRAHGLDRVRHERPSSIGVDTLARTAAGLNGGATRAGTAEPGAVKSFMRAAGVPERYLELGQVGAGGHGEAAEVYIVHSLADRGFAQRLYDQLQHHGRRCWLHEQPMLPGEDLDDSFDLGPRRYDALVLCCSTASLRSWWLAAELDEVAARAGGTGALVPVQLGDAQSEEAWAKARASRKLPAAVADFTDWESDEASFHRAVEQLMAGIDHICGAT